MIIFELDHCFSMRAWLLIYLFIFLLFAFKIYLNVWSLFKYESFILSSYEVCDLHHVQCFLAVSKYNQSSNKER